MRENNNMTAAWRADQPFDSIPLLPPAQDLESKRVLKQCIEARAAVAELKQAAELLPNQKVLINTLPLLEAQASSEIENIVTTADRLFQFRGKRREGGCTHQGGNCATAMPCSRDSRHCLSTR